MTADTAAKALDWDRLFQTHYRSLYRALVGATGRTDGVDDAIQDAFAQGLRGKLPNEVRSVEGWLFVVRKVNDAFEFICALGDKIKRFVLSHSFAKVRVLLRDHTRHTGSGRPLAATQQETAATRR